jgi:endoglucanase
MPISLRMARLALIAVAAGVVALLLVGAPTPSETRAAAASSNPFDGARFYVNPSSNAARTARAWRAGGRTGDATAITKIAGQPNAVWFGDWNGRDPSADVRAAVGSARGAGALPVLVAYDIPGRDCGGYSAGGARSASGYRTWIGGLARGIGTGRAVVILEPDAIPELDCMSPADQRTTLSLLSYAVQRLGSSPGTSVYLDAGNRGWQPPAVVATRLKRAGVAGARGFSLNVSNFDWTSSEEAYGNRISSMTGGKHFVVDTSRNGRGPASGAAWCNPPGRGLGRPATTATGDPLADALLWIKAPGESDGLCNGGPAAGVWWPRYALGLARRASF